MAEDNAGVVLSVRLALTTPDSAFEFRGASTTGHHTAEWCAENSIDLLVADWRLPDLDGIDLIVRAKELRPALRAVLITGYPSPGLTVRALAAGVDAILFKPFGGDELCASLRLALTGRRSLCPEAARHLADFLQQNAASADGVERILSPREAELLTLLGQGQTLKEAAHHLHICEGTAATHRKRIFVKLKAHKLQEALGKFIPRGGDPRDAGRR